VAYPTIPRRMRRMPMMVMGFIEMAFPQEPNAICGEMR
jgi:hypothetical protein